MKIISILFLSALVQIQTAYAEPAKEAAEDGETVDVSKIQEKYWAQGKDTELGVVQNRKYTNENKIEIALLGGSLSTDPFLSVHHLGGSIGYHFTQFLSLHAIAWKAAASPSDAYHAFEAQKATTAASVATNAPKAFYGLQGNFNFMYGKVSLLGNAIIYVDVFLLGGAGMTDTTTGQNLTPFIGIGQKIHLSRHFALDIDYRIMQYNEKVRSAGALNERSNKTEAVTLGICYFVN